MTKPSEPTSINRGEIEGLIQRLEARQLGADDARLVSRLLRPLLNLIAVVEQKNSSIKRLKRLLFGPGSDKRTPPAPRPEAKPLDASAESAVSSAASPDEAVNSVLRPKRKGHGRLGAESYVGAKVVSCADPVLRPGDRCPHTLCGGRLYDTDEPTILIRLTGQPLVGATRFEQQVLRCSTCQQRYTSPLPEGVPPQKYDASADVAIALADWLFKARAQYSCNNALAL